MDMQRGEAVRPAGAPMVAMPELRPSGGEGASAAVAETKDAARALVSEARVAGSEAAQTARQRAQEELDRRSTEAGARVADVAGDARDVAALLRDKGRDRPAQLADGAAERIERFAAYLRETDGQRILEDARDFGRRQPAAIVAGAAVLGIVAGRLVRASAPESREVVR